MKLGSRFWFRPATVRVPCGFPAVLFDALLDNAVRNGEHLIDKSRKVCKFALFILGRVRRASWLLRHDRRSVQCRAPKVNTPRAVVDLIW
jgi:hypothetical protein